MGSSLTSGGISPKYIRVPIRVPTQTVPQAQMLKTTSSFVEG